MGMEKVHWEPCGNHGYIAFLNGYTLWVDRSKNGWTWEVSYYERIADGTCRTPNGAKAAATFYAKRHP